MTCPCTADIICGVIVVGRSAARPASLACGHIGFKLPNDRCPQHNLAQRPMSWRMVLATFVSGRSVEALANIGSAHCFDQPRKACGRASDTAEGVRIMYQVSCIISKSYVPYLSVFHRRHILVLLRRLLLGRQLWDRNTENETGLGFPFIVQNL